MLNQDKRKPCSSLLAPHSEHTVTPVTTIVRIRQQVHYAINTPVFLAMSVGLVQVFASSNWNTIYEQSTNTCEEYPEGPRIQILLIIHYVPQCLLTYNNTSIGSSDSSDRTVDCVIQFI